MDSSTSYAGHTASSRLKFPTRTKHADAALKMSFRRSTRGGIIATAVVNGVTVESEPKNTRATASADLAQRAKRQRPIRPNLIGR